MITIEILDEAHFKDSNELRKHHAKHVLSKNDETTRLDHMNRNTYDELTDKLSSAKCGGPNDKKGVIGFKLSPSQNVKYDTSTKLFTIYDPQQDSAETLYKLKQNQIQDYRDQSAFMYDHGDGKAEPLPEEETQGDVFNYSTFMSSHDEMVARSKLDRTLATLQEICIELPNDVGTKLLGLFPGALEKYKLPVRNQFVATILRPRKGEIPDMMNPKKIDKYVVDQLSLALRRVGERANAEIVAKYSSPNVLALKVSFEPDGLIGRISPYDSTIMILAGSDKITAQDIDPDKFKPIGNGMKFPVSVNICYSRKYDAMYHTRLE